MTTTGEDYNEPLYAIRVAARLVGLHVQTLRYYERSGLVKPRRSSGNVRYYSAHDVERIRRIKGLMDELGVNLAGVDVILRMNEQMAEMESQLRMLETRLAQLTGRKYLPAGRDMTKTPEATSRSKTNHDAS